MKKAAIALAMVLMSAAPALAQDAAKGKTLFEQRCVMCHGPQGLGDGPVAATVPADQKPRNLQSDQSTWKFATDDTKFTELLKKGGAGVGLSPLMPPQPDLVDTDIASVIAYVHTLKK